MLDLTRLLKNWELLGVIQWPVQCHFPTHVRCSCLFCTRDQGVWLHAATLLFSSFFLDGGLTSISASRRSRLWHCLCGLKNVLYVWGMVWVTLLLCGVSSTKSCLCTLLVKHVLTVYLNGLFASWFRWKCVINLFPQSKLGRHVHLTYSYWRD